MLDLTIKELLIHIRTWVDSNKEWLFSGIGIILLIRIAKFIYNFFAITKKTVRELIDSTKQDGVRYKSNLAYALRIDEIMKASYPEYNDYLLIQYGSSVDNKVAQPNDYDFIVLLLGHPDDDEKEIQHIGSYPYIEDDNNMQTKVDVVFRDYTSFLFAACAGMPYENSIITNSRLLHGHIGYYQWLKNITGNILIDRDFLLRRFEDKIRVEKDVFDVEVKFGRHEYDLVRAGYYYVTSKLQYNRIKKLNKILNQDCVVGMAKVNNLVDDIIDKKSKKTFVKLIELLKRSVKVDGQINPEEIIQLIENINKESA